MVRDGAEEMHLFCVAAGDFIDLSRTRAIVAISGAAILQQHEDEVVLEALDSQLILNSEKFIVETFCRVVEGFAVAAL